MKLFGSIASLVTVSFVSLSAFAVGAVSSGGGAQPPPETPSMFTYECKIQVSRIQATSTRRYEGTIEADYVFAYDETAVGGFFNGMINFAKLNWKTLPNSKNTSPLAIDLSEPRVLALSFDKTTDGFNARLSADAVVQTTAGASSNYAKTLSSFESYAPFSVEANVESRPAWIDGKLPKGFLMDYAAVAATCRRTK